MCGRFALYTEPVKVARFLQATPGASGRLATELEHPADGAHRGCPRTGGRQRRGHPEPRPLPMGTGALLGQGPIRGQPGLQRPGRDGGHQPMFRHAFATGKRILIPADAFYEWTKTGGPKVPNAFRRSDGEPIVFAGLCEYWKAPDDEWMQSATIITTSDNPDMHEIHNRMPVILEKSTWDQWVNPGFRGP